jgi:hypothetical protein
MLTMDENQQQRLDELNGEGLGVASNATPLEILETVYRNLNQLMQRRLKAATEAAQYVHPKLAVTANVSDHEFGFRLDQAIERSGTAPKLIEHQPTKIEPQAPVPSKPMLGPVPDKRFRR